MNRFAPLRVTAVIAAAIAALVVTALPAGAFQETVHQGTPAFYQITEPGVVCKYENNPGFAHDELNKVVIRKFHAHGPYAQNSLVGRRYIVEHNTPPHSDNVFTTYYKSPIVRKPANDAIPAYFGPITWNAPENTRDRWRIWIVLYFYAQGSSTNVVGKVRGLIEVYTHRISNAASYDIGTEGGPSGYCRREFY